MDELDNEYIESEEIKDSQEWMSEQNVGSSPKEVLQRYASCRECGSHLHFTYLTDFSKNLTQETARCPECGSKSRRLIYNLH